MVREIPMSQLGISPESIVDDRTSVDLEPEPEYDEYRFFEGPRYHFPLLLGLSSVWSGRLTAFVDRETGPVCRFCGRSVVVVRIRMRLRDGTRIDVQEVRRGLLNNAPLPEYAYCFGCDRCGKDNVIGTAQERRDSVRRVYDPKPGLKGGVG